MPDGTYVASGDRCTMERLVGDLQRVIEELQVDHKFWEIRIHGSDGIARLEIVFQERNKYDLRAK